MPVPEGPESRPSSPSAEPSTHAPIDRSGRLLAALERLETAVNAIHDSASFRAYLDVQARFHQYSSNNALLILAQRPDATRVAGYQTWKSLGRQVRHGERGITIIVPMRVRDRSQTDGGMPIPEPPSSSSQALATEPTGTHSTDSPASEVIPADRRLRFGVGTVFDLTQTDGRPLPSIEVPLLTAESGQALYRRLEQFSQQEGLTIQRGSARLGPTTMGFYSPAERLIVLREAAQLQMTKTLAHELAHHVAGHAMSGPAVETEAEGIAYVVLAHAGLDSGARSFPYIATWAQDRAVLTAALSRIQQVSATIIRQLPTTG